jgi:hypothetical protein
VSSQVSILGLLDFDGVDGRDAPHGYNAGGEVLAYFLP